jgi:large subunit ribosomal protein L22
MTQDKETAPGSRAKVGESVPPSQKEVQKSAVDVKSAASKDASKKVAGSTAHTSGTSAGKSVAKKVSDVRVMRKKIAETPASKCACAVSRRMRVSPQKLNLLVKDVRGLPVSKALALLKFSRRRIAGEARRALLSAMANAEHNKGLDVDTLCVAEASVGRALVMKRLDIKGRSRSGRIERPLSHLRIVVAEIE